MIFNKIDSKFIDEAILLQKKYRINPAGEGGEFETFVVDCPLFKKALKVVGGDIVGEENTFHMEVRVE